MHVTQIMYDAPGPIERMTDLTLARATQVLSSCKDNTWTSCCKDVSACIRKEDTCMLFIVRWIVSFVRRYGGQRLISAIEAAVKRILADRSHIFELLATPVALPKREGEED